MREEIAEVKKQLLQHMDDLRAHGVSDSESTKTQRDPNELLMRYLEELDEAINEVEHAANTAEVVTQATEELLKTPSKKGANKNPDTPPSGPTQAQLASVGSVALGLLSTRKRLSKPNKKSIKNSNPYIVSI